jgi:hypothetical protein
MFAKSTDLCMPFLAEPDPIDMSMIDVGLWGKVEKDFLRLVEQHLL